MGSQAVITRKTAALMALTVVGFGLLQGARIIDLGTGPYSPEPFAIIGIAAGGVTYLTIVIITPAINVTVFAYCHCSLW